MTWPFDADPQTALNAQDPAADQSGGWGGMFSPGSFMGNPDFRRHAAYDALTNAGLGLIAASAPSSTPQNFGNMFGALAGGAAQGVQGSADRYMKMAQAGMQMRNLQMQTQMYPAMMKALTDDGTPPTPPQAAPGGPVSPPQQQTAADESGNNPAAVNPQSGAYGKYQFMPETWAGVATKHPELKLPFNMKQANAAQQDAAKTALDQDNAQGLAAFNIPPTPANLYLAHRFGVGGTQQFLNQPDDTKLASFMPKTWIDQNKDLQDRTVGQFKGAVAQRYGGEPMPQGGDQPTGNQPGVMPAPAAAPNLPPPPQPIPIPKALLAAKMVPQLKDAAQAKIDAINRQNTNAMERWKANTDLLKFTAEQARHRETMDQTARNQKVTAAGPNKELIGAEAEAEMAKKQAESAAHEKSVFGGPGWADVPPDQFRKLANPQVISLADGLQKGTVRLSTLGNSVGRGGTPITKADVITAGQKLYGDQFNPDSGDIRHKFEQDIKDSDTQIGKTVFAVNTVYKHLDRYQDLVLAQQNGDTPLINKIRKELNDQAGYNKFTSAAALQPALGTEIANVIKGAQLNMPEVEGAIEELKTTKSDPQMLDTVNTLRHAMGDRESTITEKAADAYVPKERIDKIVGATGRTAIGHFDKVQQDYRAAHPEKFGGAPVKPAVSAMPLIASPAEAAKLGKGAQFRFMQNGQEMIGTVP